MQYLILILATSLFFSCAAQENCGSVIIDDKHTYIIPNHGRIKDVLENVQDTIRAKLLVNDDTISQIEFGFGKIVNDTLTIQLYGLNESVYQKLVIRTKTTEYCMDYTFLQSGVEEKISLKVLQTKLKLKNRSFSKGSVVEGSIEYSAQCEVGCINDEYIITIRGNFSVPIR